MKNYNKNQLFKEEETWIRKATVKEVRTESGQKLRKQDLTVLRTFK